MEQHDFVSRVIHNQKTASDQFFALLSVAQNNSESMLKITLDQCKWLPDSSKKSCFYWNENFLKATENMKKFIDIGYAEAEKMLSESSQENQQKSPVKTKGKKASDGTSKGKDSTSTTSPDNESEEETPVTS